MSAGRVLLRGCQFDQADEDIGDVIRMKNGFGSVQHTRQLDPHVVEDSRLLREKSDTTLLFAMDVDLSSIAGPAP